MAPWASGTCLIDVMVNTPESRSGDSCTSCVRARYEQFRSLFSIYFIHVIAIDRHIWRVLFFSSYERNLAYNNYLVCNLSHLIVTEMLCCWLTSRGSVIHSLLFPSDNVRLTLNFVSVLRFTLWTKNKIICIYRESCFIVFRKEHTLKTFRSKILNTNIWDQNGERRKLHMRNFIVST